MFAGGDRHRKNKRSVLLRQPKKDAQQHSHDAGIAAC
jgi:hypothetical protein